MRVLLAIALFVAPVVSAGTVEGRALIEAAPLPGCAVTLSSGSFTRTLNADAEGRYSFRAIPPGSYTITFDLSGLTTETRDISVGDEVTRVDDVELRLDAVPETVTISCGFTDCSTSDPETPFDRPVCTEYDLNTGLIEASGRGDASAIDLLRQHYKTTFTYFERHRIAAALLGKVDDREYWNELADRAKEAIRFAYVDDKPSPEFVQWCEARGVNPEEYRWMTIEALRTAGVDRRARGLVLEALESNDKFVVQGALISILELRDETLLPKIENAIERFPEDAADTAMWLMAYRSDAADQIAMKFLSEDGREEYREQQRMMDCENMNPCDP